MNLTSAAFNMSRLCPFNVRTTTTFTTFPALELLPCTMLSGAVLQVCLFNAVLWTQKGIMHDRSRTTGTLRLDCFVQIISSHTDRYDAEQQQHIMQL